MLWAAVCCTLSTVSAVIWFAVPDEPRAVAVHRARNAFFMKRHKLSRGKISGSHHKAHGEGHLDPNDAIEHAEAMAVSHAAAQRAVKELREEAEEAVARLEAAEQLHERELIRMHTAHASALANQADVHAQAITVLRQQQTHEAQAREVSCSVAAPETSGTGT